MKIKTLILIAFLGALFCIPARAQQQQAQAPATVNKSLWQQISEGGWVMVPIGLCSVLTLYFIVDGVMRTAPKKVMPEDSVAALQNLFRAGDYVGAYNFCKANPSAFANVTRMAVSLIGDGKTAVEEGVLSEMAKEDSKIQTQLSYLSVIGVCAPMIGLLGTVTGMIRAFATLGASGIGDPSSLAAAIGEVLVATASGLFIAIPAFGAFYFLRNRAVKAMHDVEDGVTTLFRKFPYEMAAGVHIGDENLYAAPPNWLGVEPQDTTETVQA
jgi:biopolymer transport protein ExbB